MPRNPYLHELKEFPDLIRIISAEKGITPQLVEKDYWIMHCLYGLNDQGFDFELKGGTSLSKGFNIIKRFSEDIDIRFIPPNPDALGFEVFTGKNQTKKEHHIKSRQKFYDWLAETILIDGVVTVERDHAFDDELFRSGGIRLQYDTQFESVSDLKEGILLEIGFDDTTPNEIITMSSWAYNKAASSVEIIDNKAIDIKCYHPGYTFVEKMQAISTKFRHQQESGVLPTNFLRHYYDISQLLSHPAVLDFIGTEKYQTRKSVRFRKGDNQNIAENEAFILSDPKTKNIYATAFSKTADLYYEGQPDFNEIIDIIHSHIDKL